MRPLIEKGYLYIAQPPLYRVKKGNSEVYRKDDREMEDYLLRETLGAVMLRLGDNTQLAGDDLMAMIEKARTAKNLLEAIGRKVGNRDGVSTAAVAGVLNRGVLSESGNAT